MFPLKHRHLINSAAQHIKDGKGMGADYEADYVELFAPFNGICEWKWGVEGGWWWKLYRDNGDIIEMAHNSHVYLFEGRVIAGECVAITGNTGKKTTGPHLHIQIFNRSGQRLDPEKYNWEEDEIPMIINTLVKQQQDRLNALLTGKVVVVRNTDNGKYYEIENNKKKPLVLDSAFHRHYAAAANTDTLNKIPNQ